MSRSQTLSGQGRLLISARICWYLLIMTKMYRSRKVASRLKPQALQKLVTIELNSGCGFQWHLEPFLHDGWHIVHAVPVPGGSARENVGEDKAGQVELVTSWLAVLLEKPARFA